MGESHNPLYKPLAFHPFNKFDLLPITATVRPVVAKNNSPTNCIPSYYAMISKYFPVLKQCSALEESVVFDSSQMLQNFPQISAREYDGIKRTNFPFSVAHSFSTTSNNSEKRVARISSTLQLETLTPSKTLCHPIKTDACNNKKTSEIWRPFSPENDSYPSLNKAMNLTSFSEVPACQLFPAILPSSVKLRESSAFKAVKKKRYRCQHCDQWYLNSGQLASHIRGHIGSKPYSCEYQGCSRAFARNEELTRHRRIHSGVKPHQCDTCQKKFGRKDHLNKHRKTHMKASEKKIYLCEVPGCKHRYTRSDALARHLSTAHSIKHRKFNLGRSTHNLLLLPDAKSCQTVEYRRL